MEDPMTKKTARNVAEKLIEAHLVSGEMTPGTEIGLRVDQGLLQDALGTLSMLALEAMEIDRVRTDAACQYVDHNLLQTDTKNADDHTFLRTASARFGMYFSPPGNGISHPVHMERLGKPGALLLGSDSHSCAAGSLGMFGMGTGSIEVAMSLAGMPVYIRMPEIWGVKLTGSLPDWVSAKDVILEMLRHHGVTGGLGRVIEYYGPGLDGLSAMDRHVIANMGAEMGATTSVFPSDGAALEFLRLVGREDDWTEILADEGATYDVHEEIDLSTLEPLIAKPSSPGNVVPVREVAGQPVYQAYIGSSANPGYRDFAVAAQMFEGRQVATGVSFDINPSSREMLANLMNEGLLANLIQAGARLHQAGCNGCHGMGQSPAAGKNSLRTTPRNFDGRSGVKEDLVFLCSPETAAAAALTGVITDPRDLDMPYPKVVPPKDPIRLDKALIAPPPLDEARSVTIEKGSHTASLPLIDPYPDAVAAPILIKLGDDVSTDAIAPAGAQILPYRSNVQKTAEFTLMRDDETFAERAMAVKDTSGHVILGSENFGQGSSRVHAVLCPQYLGAKIVLAKSFARIYWQNLINAGMLPLTFADPADYDRLEQGDVLVLDGVHDMLPDRQNLTLAIEGKGEIAVEHALTPRQIEILIAGGLINWGRDKLPRGNDSETADA
jgi:aconitate hydratase